MLCYCFFLSWWCVLLWIFCVVLVFIKLCNSERLGCLINKSNDGFFFNYVVFILVVSCGLLIVSDWFWGLVNVVNNNVGVCVLCNVVWCKWLLWFCSNVCYYLLFDLFFIVVSFVIIFGDFYWYLY